MKKKSSHKKHKSTRIRRTAKTPEGYLVVVRSWMLLVMFALMLGLGAVVGTYLNNQSSANTPAVAGAHIDLR